MDIHDFPSPAYSPSVQSEGEGKQGRDRGAQNGEGAATLAGDGLGHAGAITAIRHAAAGERSPAVADGGSCACPLCGGALRHTGFNFVDRFIVYGENYCVLTKSQALVFRLLFEARPNVVPTERLYNAICAALPYEKEYPDPSILRVFLMNVRKKLAEVESPYRIRSSSGVGYALVYKPKASYQDQEAGPQPARDETGHE